MADAGLEMVALAIRAQPIAEGMGRDGLADRADVVAFALDGQQHHAPDHARINAVAPPLQLAERKLMLTKAASCTKPGQTRRKGAAVAHRHHGDQILLEPPVTASQCAAYCAHILELPFVQEWCEAARAERYEVIELDAEF